MVKVLVSVCKANKGRREKEQGLATKVRKKCLFLVTMKRISFIPFFGNCKNTKSVSFQFQRDKLGNYFLWGKSNNKPVYQHESGLDFMYYHTNHVWGVGPKGKITT
jgi:hypothetical protein